MSRHLKIAPTSTNCGAIEKGSGLMSVSRIVPDIRSKQLDTSRQFYADVLGLEVAMDMGFIVTMRSSTNSTAQVTLMRDDESSAILPQMSVEVADVDDVHARAVSHGFKVVYPLTNEPWGVRRFFVTDPNGTIINVMCHIGGGHSD
jgi:predicted enzyme related to lactoylglutathione lyase